MVNYLNNYYLDDIIEKGAADINQMKPIIIEKFGNIFNFSKLNESTKYGCSCFNVRDSYGHNLFGRNFDFPEDTNIILWTKPKGGYRSITFSDGKYIGFKHNDSIAHNNLLLAPYIPMDGMNERGLSIGGLFLRNNPTHQNKQGQSHLIGTVMMRGVLDNCANVQEAIKFFESHNMNDIVEWANHYIITDAKGDAVVIEYWNNEMIVVKPNNFAKSMYVTNFYLSHPEYPEKIGEDRYEIIEQNLKHTNYTMNSSATMDVLRQARTEAVQMPTLWSNVYDTKSLKLVTAFKMDYKTLYNFDVKKPLVVTIDKINSTKS